MKFSLFFSVLTWLLQTQYAVGQNSNVNSPGKMFQVGAGISINSLSAKNNGLSSLPFSGTAPAVQLNVSQRTSRSFGNAVVHFYDATLNSPLVTTLQIKNQLISADIFYAFGISPFSTDSPYLLIGPAINYIYNKRRFNGFVNKRSETEQLLSLSALVGFRFGFRIGNKKISIEETLQVPFVSGVSAPDGGWNGDKKSKWYVTGFSSLFRVLNTLNIDLPLNGESSVALAYQFQTYTLKHSNRSQYLLQGIEVIYRYQL